MLRLILNKYHVQLFLIAIPMCQTFCVDQAVSDTLTTRDCSPILKEVIANTINVYVRCDEETEAKLIVRLAKEPWAEQCTFRYPQSWLMSYDDANSEYSVWPGGDNYFSRFDFIVKMGRTTRYYSEPPAEKTPPGGEPSQSNDTPSFDSPGVVSDKVIDNFKLRAFFSYEDGSAVETGRVSVTKDSSRSVYQANMELEDASNAYPQEGEEIQGMSFDCEADTAMNLDTFKNLCKSVVEKTTAREEFGFGGCEEPTDQP